MILKFNKKRYWQALFIFFILIGAAGSVFFFPLKLSESHTCICHKMTCPRDTCCPKGSVLSTEINKDTNHQVMNKMSQQHHGELVNQYLIPYGFLWWGSLILLVSGIYLLQKNIRGFLPQSIF